MRHHNGMSHLNILQYKIDSNATDVVRPVEQPQIQAPYFTGSLCDLTMFTETERC